MRFLIIPSLLLGPSINPAFAEVVPPAPAALALSSEAISAQKSAHETAIADCDRMWDRGTHMTRREWLTTCRRVQDRLQNLQAK